MKVFGWFACLLALACGREQDALGVPTEPTRPVAADEVTELGFAFADLAVLDQRVTAVLEWKSGHSGFAAVPSTGTAAAEARLTYKGGELYVLGDPVRVMEGWFTLRTSTSDGALQEEVKCLMRATALDAWICDGSVPEVAGSFALTQRPAGDVSYSLWISERYGTLMGGVSVVPTANTVEELPGESFTGSLTSFSAGVWLDGCPGCAHVAPVVK